MSSRVTAVDGSTTGRHILALDGLRGVAILLVLMYHLLSSNPTPAAGALIRLLARIHTEGWIGVSLFFVLSGFLITGILYDTLADNHYFRNFYARRTLRVFPLYYGFILLLFLVTRFTSNHWFQPATLEILTYTFSLPITGSPYTDASWINLNHFWTLAIEEQFYLVWPLLVFFLRTRRRIIIAALTGMASSLSIRLACVLFTNMSTHPYIVSSWSPSQLDGLCFGSLLAVLIRSRHRARAIRIAPYLLALGGAMLLAVCLHNGSLAYEGHNAVAVFMPLLLACTFGALLLSCLAPRTLLQRAFELPVLRFFGRYSYGLYVIHYTIASSVVPIRRALLSHGHSKLVSLLVPATITFVLSVAAAWLSFRYLESPFLRLKDRFTNRSRHTRLAEVVATPSPSQ